MKRLVLFTFIAASLLIPAAAQAAWLPYGYARSETIDWVEEQCNESYECLEWEVAGCRRIQPQRVDCAAALYLEEFTCTFWVENRLSWNYRFFQHNRRVSCG